MSKYYVFTSFTLDIDLNKFYNEFCEYLIFQKEKCPTSGKEHLQGYFVLHNRKRVPTVKKLIGNDSIHLERRKGTHSDAVRYCSKSETQIEPPTIMGTHEEPACKWDEIHTLLKSGDIATVKDKYFSLYSRYKRSWGEIMCESFLPFTSPRIKGVWLTGPKGCGKTRLFMERRDVYLKGFNKWWDGYMGERIILIDDVSTTTWTFLLDYIKRWADHYPCRGETKGSHVYLQHEYLCITSNETLDESLSLQSTSHFEAIKRRFIQFHSTSPFWEESLTTLLDTKNL